MNIAIIDADLIGRKKHRFPNLACMKISAYYKKLGHEVRLETSYDTIENYDKVFVSKVFTDTPVPDKIHVLPWVKVGGTGFYFDKAPALSDEIEHCFPDYHLYDDFIVLQKQNKRDALKANLRDVTIEDLLAIDKKIDTEFKSYTDYSIGFITRGCFRKCGFCVNKKYDRVFLHSPLHEFFDPNRPKICLLDDNFLGQAKWKECLEMLIATDKPFKFMQGLDERLLTPEKCELLFSSKYDGEITFAFDKLEDYSLIEKKLKLIRSYSDREIKFYVLCGYDDENKYDAEFWAHDLSSVFARVELLGAYSALPYLMRFAKYNDSPYKGIYITLARWINQPGFFRNQSLNEFIDATAKHGEKAPRKYRDILLRDHPYMSKYFDQKYYGAVLD